MDIEQTTMIYAIVKQKEKREQLKENDTSILAKNTTTVNSSIDEIRKITQKNSDKEKGP